MEVLRIYEIILLCGAELVVGKVTLSTVFGPVIQFELRKRHYR